MRITFFHSLLLRIHVKHCYCCLASMPWMFMFMARAVCCFFICSLSVTFSPSWICFFPALFVSIRVVIAWCHRRRNRCDRWMGGGTSSKGITSFPRIYQISLLTDYWLRSQLSFCQRTVHTHFRFYVCESNRRIRYFEANLFSAIINKFVATTRWKSKRNSANKKSTFCAFVGQFNINVSAIHLFWLLYDFKYL